MEKKRVPWNKGLKTPKEVREKQRQAKLKNPVRYWKGKVRVDMLQEKHWNWNDKNIGYRGIHLWVQKQLGKAKQCVICEKDTGRIHWANIDHKYNRDITKYLSLCPSCHKNYDKKFRATNI